MIDWARVAELRDEIGAEDFGEIVDLFLMEVEGAIDTLEGAGGDATVTEEQMHFLKGAALNLGFKAVSDLCHDGEKAAADGDVDSVTPAAVRDTFEASKTTFLNDFPQRFAA